MDTGNLSSKAAKAKTIFTKLDSAVESSFVISHKIHKSMMYPSLRLNANFALASCGEVRDNQWTE